MSFEMMYDTTDGILWETFTISDVKGCWATVMLTQIEFRLDCGCDDFACEHREVYEEVGPHPFLPGRGGVGTVLKARHIKGITMDDGVRCKCIKIYYGQGRIGVATRVGG